MRQKMIDYIERVSGCTGDWSGIDDENLKKLLVFCNPVSSPAYIEDIEFILWITSALK